MADLARVFRWLGFHFVPENYCAPVFRLGRYRRVCGPGFKWIIPVLDQLDSNIYAGVRTETFVFDEVFSANRIPFQVEVAVRFSFQPENCTHEVAVQIVRASTQALSNLVRDFTEEALRNTFGQFQAEDLFQRRHIDQVTRTASRLLTGRLQRRGLYLLTDGGLIIKRMQSPEMYQRTALAVDQLQKVMDVLAGQPDGVVDRALVAQFINAIVESNLEALSLGDASHSPVTYGYIGGNGFRRTAGSARKPVRRK